MRKLITLILLSSLVFISCQNKDHDIKTTQVSVNSSDYNFNMPKVNTDYNIMKTNFEKLYSSVTIDEKDNIIIITANTPKGSNNIFESITSTYHYDFNGFKSYNMAFTYSVKNIDSQSFSNIRNLIKQNSINQ